MSFLAKVTAAKDDEERRKQRNKNVLENLKDKHGKDEPIINFDRNEIARQIKEDSTVKPKTLTDKALLNSLENAWKKYKSIFHIESSDEQTDEGSSFQMWAYTPVQYVGTRAGKTPKFLQDEIDEIQNNYEEGEEPDLDDAVFYVLGITKKAPYVVFAHAEIAEHGTSIEPDEAHVSMKVKSSGDVIKNIEQAFDELIKKM